MSLIEFVFSLLWFMLAATFCHALLKKIDYIIHFKNCQALKNQQIVEELFDALMGLTGKKRKDKDDEN